MQQGDIYYSEGLLLNCTNLSFTNYNSILIEYLKFY